MEKPETDVDLPRALIRRIVKGKLTELAGDDSKDFSINKDALTALSESTKVFISLIASTANDICQEKRRQTVNADDIFTALQDLEFPELVGPLREQLEGKSVGRGCEGGKGLNATLATSSQKRRP